MGGLKKDKFQTCHIFLATTGAIGLVLGDFEIRLKMCTKICPVCKNDYYGEIKKIQCGDLALHKNCVLSRKRREKKQRPVRTSTPVADLGYTPAPSFSDSVTDFFYQSWKSGLHSNDTTCFQPHNQIDYQPSPVVQPFCYAPQVVYVNTVIFQAIVPTGYVQHVGYRPDGTFGVLPAYW